MSRALILMLASLVWGPLVGADPCPGSANFAANYSFSVVIPTIGTGAYVKPFRSMVLSRIEGQTNKAIRKLQPAGALTTLKISLTDPFSGHYIHVVDPQQGELRLFNDEALAEAMKVPNRILVFISLPGMTGMRAAQDSPEHQAVKIKLKQMVELGEIVSAQENPEIDKTVAANAIRCR